MVKWVPFSMIVQNGVFTSAPQALRRFYEAN